MAQGSFIRTLRQLLLFTLLIAIAGGSYLSRARSTSWDQPLWVGLYPISADDRRITNEYLSRLDEKTFAAVEQFMRSEAERFGISLDQPVRIELGSPVKSLPPPAPEGAIPPRVMLWSLKLRWWANGATSDQSGAEPHVKMFLVYHDPDINDTLPHSVGMKEGMIGVVNVFATRRMQGSNNVVIAHELLHTLGATDKYALEDNLPAFPDGYAEPDRRPLYPQRYAEIMGGRVPVSETEANIPPSLKAVRIGRMTAAEIRWIE